MPKYRFSYRHWYVCKYDPYRFTPRLAVPPGMSWIMIPPGEDCHSPDVGWFRTGRDAITYLEQLGRIHRIRKSVRLNLTGVHQ